MISVPPLSAMMTSAAVHAGVLALCSFAYFSSEQQVQSIEVSLVQPSEYESVVQKSSAGAGIPVLTAPLGEQDIAAAQTIARSAPDMKFEPQKQPVKPASVTRQPRLTTGKPARHATQMASAKASELPAMPIHNPAPEYPYSERKSGIQGRVMLRVDVAQTGEPRSVNIARSSGNPSLDSAARAAVQKWRFTSRSASVMVPVEFKLD